MYACHIKLKLLPFYVKITFQDVTVRAQGAMSAS